MKFKWTRQLTELLVAEYERREHLYNVSHPDYMKRGQREKSLEELCAKLRQFNSAITVGDVRSKIQVLRSQYTKELRILANYKRTGQVYTPKLWCFDQLKFLESYCGISFKGIPLAEAEQPPPKTEKKKGSLLTEARAALKYAVKLKAAGPPEETREEIFGKFVAAQLKQITDPDIYNDTTWAIQVALREGLEKFEKMHLS